MSAIEYSYLLIEISEKLDELSPIHRLLFTCRTFLTPGSEGNIQDTLSLFKELEEQQNLGIDNLVVIKELLKGVREWSLFGKVKRFENKRKEYNALLEEIIRVLDELNDLERLVSVCREKLSEESEGLIENVRSLFKELQNQNILGLDRLDILKEILTETEKKDLLKKVEEFEERRNKEDEFERKKAQAAALASSVRNSLTGVVNMKTVFKLFAGGLVIVSATEVLSGWSSYDQLVAAVQSCVLPAGTRLVQITDGCVCLTVQAESLSALTNLWKLYQDGTLQKRLYDFFVTEMRELADGKDVEVNVTIDQDEYQKACIELIHGTQGGATTDYVERRRRNSDSAVYCNAKELPLSRLKCLETELKYLHNRIALLEDKKENLGSHPFEQKEIAPTGSPDKNFEDKTFDFEKRGRRNSDSAVYLKANEEPQILRLQRDEAELRQKIIGLEQKINSMEIGTFEGGEKFLVAGEKMKESDKKGVSHPDGAVLMGAEKFAFVQKYLDDVQETRSTTTETSDSALGIHAAGSEFETEEIRETSKLCLKDLSPDVRRELNERLKDEAVGQKFLRFFGLQKNIPPNIFHSGKGILEYIGYLFPDTPVSVLKECFEALQLYDFAEFLAAKVRPRSLHSVLSSEEVEKLNTGNLLTSFHSNAHIAVLIFNDSDESVNAQKIEKFFGDLNVRNAVTFMDSTLKVGKRRELSDLKRKTQKKRNLEQRIPENEDQSLYSHFPKYGRLGTLRNELAILREELDEKSELVKELEEINRRAKTNIITTTENLLSNLLSNQGWLQKRNFSVRGQLF